MAVRRARRNDKNLLATPKCLLRLGIVEVRGSIYPHRLNVLSSRRMVGSTSNDLSECSLRSEIFAELHFRLAFAKSQSNACEARSLDLNNMTLRIVSNGAGPVASH